jgi:hypothetical protein
MSQNRIEVRENNQAAGQLLRAALASPKKEGPETHKRSVDSIIQS